MARTVSIVSRLRLVVILPKELDRAFVALMA